MYSIVEVDIKIKLSSFLLASCLSLIGEISKIRNSEYMISRARAVKIYYGSYML